MNCRLSWLDRDRVLHFELDAHILAEQANIYFPIFVVGMIHFIFWYGSDSVIIYSATPCHLFLKLHHPLNNFRSFWGAPIPKCVGGME